MRLRELGIGVPSATVYPMNPTPLHGHTLRIRRDIYAYTIATFYLSTVLLRCCLS